MSDKNYINSICINKNNRITVFIMMMFTSISANAYFLTGKELVNAFDLAKKTQIKQGSIKDSLEVSRIGGYIQGVIDSAKSGGILCPGLTLTIRESEKIITEYLQKNPHMLNIAAVDTIVLSLHPKYKCK